MQGTEVRLGVVTCLMSHPADEWQVNIAIRPGMNCPMNAIHLSVSKMGLKRHGLSFKGCKKKLVIKCGASSAHREASPRLPGFPSLAISGYGSSTNPTSNPKNTDLSPLAPWQPMQCPRRPPMASATGPRTRLTALPTRQSRSLACLAPWASPGNAGLRL
jgi:hypothetical protein